MGTLHRLLWAMVVLSLLPIGEQSLKAQSRSSSRRAVKKAPKASVKPARTARARPKTRLRSSASACSACTQAKAAPRRRKNTRANTTTAPCYSGGYVDPTVARQLNSALYEMRRAGLRPTITSAWRSSAYQADLHRCSRNGKCRHRRGLYYAARPGSSAHEAGFAVDIGGIAGGSRRNRYVTARGRRIIQIMKKHGFGWPYGLSDPVHFEANPTRYGYRSLKHAIKFNQNLCRAKLQYAQKSTVNRRGGNTRRSVPATSPARRVSVPVRKNQIDKRRA